MEISVAYRTNFRNAVQPSVHIREYYGNPERDMKQYAMKETDELALDMVDWEQVDGVDSHDWDLDTRDLKEAQEEMRERLAYNVDVLRRRVTIYEK